jgi:type II secretory pathway pseudopilin PulG
METAMTNLRCAEDSQSAARANAGVQRQAGFSLMEVMIAGAVITIGLLAVLGLFGAALASTQSSQMDELAHARATQALESIYTARQTNQLVWDSINNVGTITNNVNGIFTVGMVPLSDPGIDGLDGTTDDVTPPAPIVLPGPDGKLGTSDDQTTALTTFRRQILITQALDPVTNAPIPTLREVEVTVQYPGARGITRTYKVQALVSQYR